MLFSDLRGFTSFAEGREPSEVIGVLNRYLTEMSDAILDHDGTLVAYMGDGIMAVFGAPIASEDHADKALGAAREMLDKLERFNGWMRDEGLGDGFKMGIGLNTGDVMSGNVGSARRLEYTAIGDTTNTSARLEGMTKGTPYQLFVADTTYRRLREAPDDMDSLDALRGPGAQGRAQGLGAEAGRYGSLATCPPPSPTPHPREHLARGPIPDRDRGGPRGLRGPVVPARGRIATDWAKIFGFAEVLEVSAGLALVQAGEDDRALYLLTEGTLGVRMPREETAFKSIDAPSVVGELAFFDGSPRSSRPWTRSPTSRS